MKQALFLLAACSSMFWCACQNETDVHPATTSSVNIAPSSYRLIGGNSYLVLLKESGNAEDLIYVFRNQSNNSVNQIIQVLAITELQDGLDVLKADGSHIVLATRTDLPAHYHGYSLAKLSGSVNQARFYEHGFPKSNPDVDAVKCACKTLPQKESCDSGGMGATDCSVEVSGTVAGSGVTERCSVKCGEGTYACCKK
ncbi:MAG TPA: hypothetical protein PLS73_00440 [Saprospiraceae bacterium]|nr:hypothetical protein [Saprospiraceae bacterium]